MRKTIRIKRILNHEEAQKEAKETCPHYCSYCGQKLEIEKGSVI